MPRKEGKGANRVIRDYIHKETSRAASPSGSAVQGNSEGHLGPVPGDGRSRQGGGSRELTQVDRQNPGEVIISAVAWPSTDDSATRQ